MTTASAASARELLIHWAGDQDGWVRAIVGEVLLSGRELSAHELERVKDSFLVEKQLTEGEAFATPDLGDSAALADQSQTLTLRSLRGCRGVNALAEDQLIEFNPRVTVIFGENATGKTGYVRVFKTVANVRSAEPIIPDIHRATPPPGPEAALSYSVDGAEYELAWRGEGGVSPLTRISVFDAPAVALHLEEDLTYVYTPADLALFRYVHSAIEGVRSLLDGDRASREPRLNPFLTAFSRDSSIYPQIEQLGANTQIAEVERLADVSDFERSEVESLKISIEALSAQSTKGGLEVLRSRIAVTKALKTIALVVKTFDRGAFDRAAAELQRANREQDAAAARIFSGGSLPHEVRPAWQAFVEAGDQYLQAAGMDRYPLEDDSCIYCRQPLDRSAADLIRSYRAYSGGVAAAEVEAALAAMRSARAPLIGSDVGNALATLRSVLPTIEEGENLPAWAAEGRELLEAVEQARHKVASNVHAPADALPALPIRPTLDDELDTALLEAQQTVQALEGDASERQTKLSEQRARLAGLEARLMLARLLPEIRTYVGNAGWASRLRLLLAKFPNLLRSLTEVSKVASDQTLNQNFERAFYEECRRLRAPNVTLGFPGRRGQAARRKSVVADHALTAVLSEGEQKVIAVADFLAEASFRGGSAPIVFDDPVTSLDHRRLFEMADRIFALSEDHQVVVLTHDIWFASELLARFDEHPSQCSFYQVTERDGTKGVVSGGMHPRIDTPNKIKGRINKGIQDARAADEDQRADVIEKTYDHIRAWCEAVVEKDLLGEVTRRYRPNVAMQNLGRIKPDQLKRAIAEILPVYERACRYIAGHSQPLETLGVRPTVDELQRDWDELQAAHQAYAA